MLKKSPAWNAWAAIFKNTNFFESSLKDTKIEKNFSNFSYLFFPVFIIMVAPLSSVNKEILKEGKVELTRLLLL